MRYGAAKGHRFFSKAIALISRCATFPVVPNSNNNRSDKLLITRVVEFSAAHKLHRPELSEEENFALFDKCANPGGHGHNYILEATFVGEINERTGMVVHFQSLKRLLEEIIMIPLDHRNLNTDVPFLAGKLPTSENLVIALWNEISRAIIGQPWQLYRLRLGATSHNWVEYFGEKGVPHA